MCLSVSQCVCCVDARVCVVSLSARVLYLCVHVSVGAWLSVGCKMIDEVLIWISFFKDHAVMRANLFTRECAQRNVESNRRCHVRRRHRYATFARRPM